MYYKHGFTIIEMMIVVVVIGILAVALFPSLQGYILRSRDTSRMMVIRDVSNSLSSYSSDHDVYPNAWTHQIFTWYAPGLNDGCIPRDILLDGGYIGAISSDPISNRDNGCWNNSYFWYGSWVSVVGFPRFIITAFFESEYGWNIRLNLIDNTMTWIFLTGTQIQVDQGGAAPKYKVIKGVGSGFLFIK